MFKLFIKRFKPKDLRTSSMYISSFIDTVENYVASHPEIHYDESLKYKLIEAYIKHDDVLIDKMLHKR